MFREVILNDWARWQVLMQVMDGKPTTLDLCLETFLKVLAFASALVWFSWVTYICFQKNRVQARGRSVWNHQNRYARGWSSTRKWVWPLICFLFAWIESCALKKNGEAGGVECTKSAEYFFGIWSFMVCSSSIWSTWTLLWKFSY